MFVAGRKVTSLANWKKGNLVENVESIDTTTRVQNPLLYLWLKVNTIKNIGKKPKTSQSNANRPNPTANLQFTLLVLVVAKSLSQS